MANRRVVTALGAIVVFVACGGAVDSRGGSGGNAGARVGGAPNVAAAGAGNDSFGNGGATFANGGATLAAGGVTFGTGGATLELGGRTASGGRVGKVDFAAAGEAGASACESYSACGCGCCSPQSMTATDCYYPEYGEHLSDIIAQDRLAAADATCANAGCSSPRNYACCVSAPQERQDEAKYTWTTLPNAVIRINKQEGRGMCAGLTLRANAPHRASVISYVFDWDEDGSYAPCAHAAETYSAIGIEGTVYDYVGPNGCVLNVHVTLFIALPNGDVLPVRFDVDGIETQLSGICHRGI
ncbi:MAG: hypothetical protein ACOY0T_29755 [Myxococcota bacterium]